MRKIGQGRTAEVFDLENGRVVKLMLPGFPEKELQEELHCAQEVGQFDLPAPKCYGIVEMDGRKGLVYDLAAGESLPEKPILITFDAPIPAGRTSANGCVGRRKGPNCWRTR